MRGIETHYPFHDDLAAKERIQELSFYESLTLALEEAINRSEGLTEALSPIEYTGEGSHTTYDKRK